MKATIKDIADKLNISPSSVSRALNNKEGVSEETRELVKETAKKIGYSPNELARFLVNKQSNTIGVILPDIKNAYYGEILHGIIEAASNNNYTAIFSVSNLDDKKEAQYIKEMQNRQVSGLILKPTRDYTEYSSKEIHIPTVMIETSDNDSDFSFIELDDILGGEMAAAHLIDDCGYKNVAYLGGFKTSRSCISRRKGYENVLRRNSMPVLKSRIAYGDFSMESGYNMAKKLLLKDNTIDAFFAHNDIIALGALNCLDEMNIKVPKNFGLIGFDNISLASIPRIGLTTVNQPKEILGKNAFELLLNEINGHSKQRLIYQPSLIVRDTTLPK